MSIPPFKGAHGHICHFCTPTMWWHMAYDSECYEQREWRCADHRKDDGEFPAPVPETKTVVNVVDFVPPSKEDKRRYGHPRFYEILDKMAALHSSKAHDYATDEDPLTNFRMVGEATFRKPWQVAWQFIATKFFRLVNLLGGTKAPANESIDDSFMDMAVYCILAIIMREEEDAGKDKAWSSVFGGDISGPVTMPSEARINLRPDARGMTKKEKRDFIDGLG